LDELIVGVQAMAHRVEELIVWTDLDKLIIFSLALTSILYILIISGNLKRSHFFSVSSSWGIKK
jgi:hypothetical protein